MQKGQPFCIPLYAPTEADTGLGGVDTLDAQDGTGNDTVNGGTESDICQRDTGDQVSNCPEERRGSRCQKQST